MILCSPDGVFFVMVERSKIEELWFLRLLLQCSVTCGEGTQARYVSCRDAQGGVADALFCAHLPRPPETSMCYSPCGQWHAGEWSPVSTVTSDTVWTLRACRT